MKRLAALAAMTCAIVCAPSALYADCASLTGDDAERYQAHLNDAAALAAEGKTDEAASARAASQAICRDEAVLRTLANDSASADDCHMGRFWLEELIEVSAAPDPSNGERLTELEAKCPDSARIYLSSEESGVTIQLSGPTPREVVPPFAGRVGLGSYELKASLQGRRDYTATLDLSKGRDFAVHIPELMLADLPGQLEVRCDPESETFGLEAGGTTTELPCPHSESRDGAYTVQLAPDGYPVSVDSEGRPNSVTDVRVSIPPEPLEGLRLTDWGAIAIGGGVALGGASVALQLFALGLQDDVENPASFDSNNNVTSMTQRQAQDILDRASLVQGIAIGVGALGGAALIGGIVLMALPEDPYDVSVAPTASADGPGLVMSTRF